MESASESILLAALWASLDGAPGRLDAVQLEGAAGGLPSIYAVAEGAAAQVAAATLAVAELHAVRSGTPVPGVRVDRRHAVAAFRSERYLRYLDAPPRALWDPIAGDYEARDGWIRIHTNYASHREAALRALGVASERALVADAVRRWDAVALETAIVEAGGCAAAMRDAAAWNAHPQGAAVAREPLVDVTFGGDAEAPFAASAAAPLAGIRVLDLTRVIAGPVCTRVLAAYGADVMRIDPPGFDEVGGLLGDTTAGKRRVALDLRAADDRRTFERLVEGSHVLVAGYRADALGKLGYDASALRAFNPRLVTASIDAYGWSGPWRGRRGFDSLVQMSSGIAARGRALRAAPGPVSLPAQALDHGSGYLLAAATCRALTRWIECGQTSDVRVSLARTARWLMDLGEIGAEGAPDFTAQDAAPWMERVESSWGPLERVSVPGRILGVASGWSLPPGPLGSDAPAWPEAAGERLA